MVGGPVLLISRDERSGRDANGTGGGPPFTPLSSRALFISNEGLGLAGIVGGCSGTGALSTLEGSLRAGNRGGTEGTLDAGGSFTVAALGFDVCAFAGVFSCSTVRAGRFGRRGGGLEGSNAGAICRPVSIEGGLLEIEVRAVPLDKLDIVDMFETLEAIDSEEPRLAMSAEGRRGGKAGDDCEEGVRGGNLGGATGFAGLAP